jgi:hypothetical protein
MMPAAIPILKVKQTNFLSKNKPSNMTNSNQGFALKFSDKQDVAGLMQRDEVEENKLRVIVQEYLMEILSLLAFAVNLAGF